MNSATQVVMFSSKSGEWSTPQDFFDKLNWRFGPFDLDPCANAVNTKCTAFFSEDDDGLQKDWGGCTAFVNPPYGRGIDKWIAKGYKESLKENTKVVMLIPARTDTKYWHKYVMLASELYFVKRWLKFGDSQNSAPFPSAVVVFDGSNKQQVFGAMNR